MAHHPPDHINDLDDELRSLFTRATADIAPQRDHAAGVQRRLAQGGLARTVGASRAPSIAATFGVVLVVALLAGVFLWLRPTGARPAVTGAPTPTSGATATPTLTTAPFAITSVELAVTPTTIAGATCGSLATFTYTAVFHIPAHTAGGTIQFAYTLNNGRSQTPASVTASPGATSATFTFTSAGALPADHTYPGVAQVMVTSPTPITSPQVTPSGTCAQPQPTGPFQLTSASISVSPTSIAGMACGSYLTVTYTATFHLASNGPGGVIQFTYTINNGRGSTSASLTVPPGQTTATYTFKWSGALPADHTYPAPGGVMTQSPNALTSSLLGPTGACH